MKEIRLQAHRGVSSEYPEDTIASFRAAIEEGYKIIELDPKFTVDGHCVILHDRTLTRTARKDGKAPETEMKITEITLEEARSWEYGSWMDEKFTGEKIPTLDEVVALISENDVPFKFDNVWEKFTETEQETMLGTLESANLGKKLGFTCQRLDTFEKVAKRFPEAGFTGTVTFQKRRSIRSKPLQAITASRFGYATKMSFPIGLLARRPA